MIFLPVFRFSHCIITIFLILPVLTSLNLLCLVLGSATNNNKVLACKFVGSCNKHIWLIILILVDKTSCRIHILNVHIRVKILDMLWKLPGLRECSLTSKMGAPVRLFSRMQMDMVLQVLLLGKPFAAVLAFVNFALLHLL